MSNIKLEININKIDETQTIKKKRGRKPRHEKKPNILFEQTDTKTFIEDNFKESNDQIMHLKINANIKNKPDEDQFIEGYDKFDNKFNANPENIEYIYDELFNSIENEHKYDMNACCYWCCHIFNNISIGLPLKYYNDKFYTYGNFCSIECMSAYNFYSNEINHNKWNTFTLINLLNKKLGGTTIKLAPPRQTLIMFGGKKTIDEFRNSFISKNYLMHSYPMINISNCIEEIHDMSIMNQLDNNSLNKKKINFYNKKLQNKEININQNNILSYLQPT